MSYRMETLSSTLHIGKAPDGLAVEMTFKPHTFHHYAGVDESYITSVWIPNEHIPDLREWLARNG